MRKKIIIFAAALCVALSACERQSAQESAPPATAVPTAVQTTQPTATPVPVVTAQPVLAPTELPVATSAPTLSPTPVPTPRPAVTPTPEPLPTQAPSPTPEPAIEPPPSESPEPSRPTDEEVLLAYQAAKEAMGWIVGSYKVEGYDDSGLALDDTDQQTLTLTLGNGVEEILVFDRITRPGLDSMEALWGYLKNLFSDEIVDDLMAFQVTVFVEGEEGGLYALPSQTQKFQQPWITLAVLWPEEEAPVSCRVRAATEGEEEYRESLYQKVGDKWLFTQFEIPNSDKK